MKILRRLITLVLVVYLPIQLSAQLSQGQLERQAEQQVEQFLLSTTDEDIENFIDQNMLFDESKSELISELKMIREELRPYLDNVGINLMNNLLIFELSSENGNRQLFVELDHENDVITSLKIQAANGTMELSLDNLEQTIAELEKEGFAGLLHFRIKGDVFLEKGFGLANKNRNIKNDVNTIFGIGSRPIDFTVAGIYLLKQKGLLKLDDTIGTYFKNVPKDKSSITIEHLMTGQSGFPDFFHNEDDWDADLRYINRDEAVRRLMKQPLLFEPGSDRRHSHGAFGLLAALIEVVSGEEYYAFLRKHFLDPANMQRTGEYGETRGLAISDFAEGNGPSSVGLPNIPPNWGKTSWLVKGSGGMYSTLNDLLRFYELVRSETVLNNKNNRRFKGETANLDGSDRGFELFNVYFPSDTEVFLFLNAQADRTKGQQLMRALEKLAKAHK